MFCQNQLGHRLPRHMQTWVDLVRLLVLRDLRVRYRGSVLGYLWSMMNPLLYMGILSFVFAHLMRFKIENFPLFILSGILSWNLFQQSLSVGVHSIVANGSLLRKVRVPASLFPAVSVCSVLVNFVLALGPFIIIALLTGLQLTGWIFLLPVIVLPYVVFIYGISLVLASLNVSFRDIGHTLEPLLTMLFYGTPIVYPMTSLPEQYQKIVMLNPVAHFVGAFRDVLFEGRSPGSTTVVLLFALAVASLVIGISVYRSQRDSFVYNL